MGYGKMQLQWEHVICIHLGVEEDMLRIINHILENDCIIMVTDDQNAIRAVALVKGMTTEARSWTALRLIVRNMSVTVCEVARHMKMPRITYVDQVEPEGSVVAERYVWIQLNCAVSDDGHDRGSLLSEKNNGNVGALRQVNIQGTSYNLMGGHRLETLENIFYDSNGLVDNPHQQYQQDSASAGSSFVNLRRIPMNSWQFHRRLFPGPNTASIDNRTRLAPNSDSQQQQHTNLLYRYRARVTSNNHNKSNKYEHSFITYVDD
uniref:Uncharacterized protein n=1 Tax=Glossina palpalis gambiensis TaxID=67801 RepID=A0A1B0BYP8_9MUSC